MDRGWGALLVTHDVTELANAVNVRDAFLAGVSHELRTQLTPILGYLDLVVDQARQDAPAMLPMLAVIERNTQRLQDRVQELLAAGHETPVAHCAPVDMPALAASCVEKARQANPQHHYTLDCAVLPRTQADAGLLRRAIDELLANAAKFCPAPARIGVEATCDAGGVEVSVCDDGPGMDPSERAQAFDAFYRTRTARDTAIQGIGLGLAAVRHIAGAHEGTVSISAATAPDQGSEGAGLRVAMSLPW